jgi:hypothetical protein
VLEKRYNIHVRETVNVNLQVHWVPSNFADDDWSYGTESFQVILSIIKGDPHGVPHVLRTEIGTDLATDVHQAEKVGTALAYNRFLETLGAFP